jgi:general secretion pathway protein K
MITVALVAKLAAAALWRQWRGEEVEAAERARTQAAWVLVGALDWGRLILAGDLRESSVDHLGEPWAVPLAEARLSTFLAAGENSEDLERDAFLSGQITDLQSRLNLMNLVQGSDADQQFALGVFTRLFDLLGLPASELNTLQTGLQAARQAMAGAGGSGNSADAPMLPQRFEQITWLGVSPDTVAALAPYATLLPSASITPVNLNTASAEALYAALPGLDLAQARQMVMARQQQYFRDVADAMSRITASADVQTRWADVRSSFFEIRGRLRLDDVALEEVAVVRRDNSPSSRQVVPLWRYRTALSVPVRAGL